jgi:hypothetical protein
VFISFPFDVRGNIPTLKATLAWREGGTVAVTTMALATVNFLMYNQTLHARASVATQDQATGAFLSKVAGTIPMDVYLTGSSSGSDILSVVLAATRVAYPIGAAQVLRDIQPRQAKSDGIDSATLNGATAGFFYAALVRGKKKTKKKMKLPCFSLTSRRIFDSFQTSGCTAC